MGASRIADRYDVVIVGGGPAGAAAALQLARSNPGLASRTLLLDGSTFPREKLCGGGLVPESERFLGHLGIAGGFSSVPVRRIVFRYPGGESVRTSRRFFRVVHRHEFDHALIEAARARGVTIDCGARVTALERETDGVRIDTAGGARIAARIVIGADGARSRVRQQLVGAVRSDRFVALEVLSRGHDLVAAGGGETAVFDFTPARDGSRGYAWDFPSIRHGEPWMNRGLGSATRGSRSTLRDEFARLLRSRGLVEEASHIEGAGAPLYDPNRPQGAPRVLLAGDAVGIDPWFGEGISVALGTGIVAANAALEALATGDLDFSDHAERIAESAVGWSLRRKRFIAELFYTAATLEGGLARFFGGAGEALPSGAGASPLRGMTL